MSDEGRRVFPMETALAVVAGKDGDDVLDFLGYAAGRAIDEDTRVGVNPMVKGWLYALNPDFAKLDLNPNISFENWVGESKRKLGDNVSVTPMCETDQAAVGALIDYVENARQVAQEKTDEAAAAVEAKEAAEAEAKVLAPFKKKAEDLTKKVEQLEAKNSSLSSELDEAKEKLSSFDGKVAIDEKEIEKNVKDIVSRAVGGLVAAGGAVAGAAAEGDAAAADFGAAESDSGGVPDSFGFGASGSDGDGFGF